MKVFAMFAVSVVATVMPALAHHSFAAEYDDKKPVKLSGAITKVEWLNPHVRFYMDVKDQDAKVSNWEFELGSPNGLMRSGWQRSSLKLGDMVTVEGHRAKDNSALANAGSVTLSDGRKLFTSGNDNGANEIGRGPAPSR
jgi:hypothetical protein